MTDYIHVRNWDTFQHADTTKRGRAPTWIKTYTRLLSDQDYLDLSGPQRAALHGIWLEHARSGGKVPESTAKLSRRLGLRITKKTLQALKTHGFIDFRQDTVTPPSRLEERREEKNKPLLARPPVEGWSGPEDNVTHLRDWGQTG